MKITIAGLAASTTSTAGENLARAYGVPFYSGGKIMREMAKDSKIEFLTFLKIAKNRPTIDTEVDSRLEEIGRTQSAFVMESRLARKLVPDSIKIKFVRDDRERYDLVRKRELQQNGREVSIETARQETELREQMDADRFGADYMDDKYFDLTFDVSRQSQLEIVECMVKRIAYFVVNHRLDFLRYPK